MIGMLFRDIVVERPLSTAFPKKKKNTTKTQPGPPGGCPDVLNQVHQHACVKNKEHLRTLYALRGLPSGRHRAEKSHGFSQISQLTNVQ